MYPDDGNTLTIDFDFLAVDIDIFLYSYLLGNGYLDICIL